MKIDVTEFFHALGYEIHQLDGNRVCVRHPKRRAGRRFWTHFDRYTWCQDELDEMRRRLRKIWSVEGQRYVQTNMTQTVFEIKLIDLFGDEVGCDVMYSCTSDTEGYALILAIVQASRILKREAAKTCDVPGAAERDT